jgi:hypothetical protein
MAGKTTTTTPSVKYGGKPQQPMPKPLQPTAPGAVNPTGKGSPKSP